MAPVDSLDFRSPIVRVTISNSKDVFSIPHHLLSDQAPLLKLEQTAECEYEATTKYVVEVAAFNMFARFLHTGRIVRAPLKDESLNREMTELMSAYDCGHDVSWTDFMDAVSDIIVDGVTSHGQPFYLRKLVDDFFVDVDEDSTLWCFASDYALYFKGSGRGEEEHGVLPDFVGLKDNDFLLGLGQRAMQAKGVEVPEGVLTPELCRTFAVGFREEVNYENRPEVDRFP